MSNCRRRRFVPRALPLESRRLLSNFTPSWLGQTANMDLNGPDAGVGPDGYVDDEIQLTTSNASLAIDFVQISLNGSIMPKWESSPDVDRYSDAELIDVSGSSGKSYNVFINPFGTSGPKLTGGQTLTVYVYYHDQNGTKYTDTLSLPVGASNPNLTTTLSAPASITWNGFSETGWTQDSAQNGGAVHISLSNVGHSIQGAVLSDQVESNANPSYWGYGSLASSGGGTLSVSQSGSNATVSFLPIHDETSATMTLRLDFGSSFAQQAVQFLGQKSDPGLTVQDISSTSNTETPSSNLQVDANKYGTIYLTSGTYNLTAPLILNNPVTICPASGASATLVFSQPQTNSAASNVWDAAIQINASHVTVQGFSIQFTGPILWTHTNSIDNAVIKTYPDSSLKPRIDVCVTNMTIQGPSQSLFDQATDPIASVAVSPLLQDPFTSNTIGTTWRNLSGNWAETGGVLSQTSTAATSSEKKVIAISTTPFPGAEEIEANVLVQSIGGDGRVGIGLNNDTNGYGYNLVFHPSSSGMVVQLLNDHASWSSAVTGSWSLNTWYTFKLVVVPQGSGVDALFGKVWPAGGAEPTTWTIQEIVSSGNRSPGVPSFVAGSSGSADYATAEFEPLSESDSSKAGSLVWAVTPYLFSAVDSTRWQAVPGSTGWSQNSAGVLSQTDTSFNTDKRVLFPMPETAPSSMMITAEVMPGMNLSDPNLANSTVGVGLDIDTTGSGYELAFTRVGSVLVVQLLNGGAPVKTWTNDSWGVQIQTGYVYGMQLMVLHQPDGTDSVFGMVWRWFQSDGHTLNSVPHYWNMWTAGATHALGSPALDGGSSGDATGQFASIQVTAATTPALPLIDMQSAYTGVVTSNTLTGGSVILAYGPWTVTNNTLNGAVAGTFSTAAFNLASGHDRTISNNTLSQASPYGKTFRLLVLSDNDTWASNDVVSSNTVTNGSGMAERSGDWRWDPGSAVYGNPNYGEFILTESFRMAYEGSSYDLSSDGRVLKIPYAQGVAPYPGDVVAILNGPNAGQWFQVAQVIQAASSSDPSYTLLMDSPLPVPSGANYAISIDEGFVNETFGSTTAGQGNTIDIRGSVSNLFSLDGFQFGTRVLDNTFMGPQYFANSGAQSNLTGTYSPFLNPNNPSDSSFPWGWTHTPVFGLQIDGNTFVDVNTTPVMGVDHVSGPTTLHANINRRYYMGQIENNTFEYSNPPSSSPVNAVQIGETGGAGADNYELSLTAENNTEVVPTSFTSAGSTVQLQVAAGTVNGQSTPTILLPASNAIAAVNLAPYFSQVGVTMDNATSQGNLDGGGYSYSSNAQGGRSVVWGAPFALGPAGQNNVVQATGQTIPLPFGSYSALLMLGTRVQGGQTDTITFHYTDGSTSTVNQWFSDWANHTSNVGESVAEQMTYRNSSVNNGQQLLTMYLYGYSLPTTAGKTVQSVQLPNDPNVKILAMTMIYQSPLNLGGAFTQVGISSDEQTNLGNLDGGGYSYSMNALGGSSVSWGPTTFILGPAGQKNVIAAGGQTIVVPGAYATSLKILATAVQGAQSGMFTVNYSDTTYTQFTQSFSDWGSNSSEPGETVVETMAYRNFAQSGGNGRQALTLYVYGYSFALNPAKQVVSITVPSDSNIKILAMDLVNAPSQVSLGNSVNLVGMTSSGESGGNLDGSGGSYAIDLLGGSVTWGSNSFNLASDGGNNVVQATGQVMALPPGAFGSLLVLATATSAVESGTFTIHYTDGTSTTVTQQFSTWFTNSSEPGETMVKQMSYYYRSGVRNSRPIYLYGYNFSLNTSKSVLSVALPNNSDIKILAMAMGSPQQRPVAIQRQQVSASVASQAANPLALGGEAPVLIEDVPLAAHGRKQSRSNTASQPIEGE